MMRILRMTACLTGVNMSFVSAVSLHSAWCYALPPHHEVCDGAVDEQDAGHLCFTPHLLIFQPFLADGKHIVQQYSQL